MRVHVVDPSAYTPPYDHALCRSLGEAGAEVELFTSHFDYGPVPPPSAYSRNEFFYRRSHSSAGVAPRSRTRLAVKMAEHVPAMLRYRKCTRSADIVHFQWLTVQPLDVHLLPRDRPLVLTAHDVLPREPRLGQLAAQRRLYERMDAIVVHSAHGQQRLVEELELDADRIHVIPHGVLRPWEGLPEQPLPEGLRDRDGPVVLFFGLLRPYKGLDVLLEAWRGIEGAELWIVGMPRMDVEKLRASAPRGVRFLTSFVPDAQIPALFDRASLVVLPYREIDQSGVLFTALGAGAPLLLSDVGGFPEIASTGAARTVPAGDPAALHTALLQLLSDPASLTQMAEHAKAAAERDFSWEQIAANTLELYRSLLER
jgi:glycosyltransferase involved in cell wall biosynthesis